MLLWVNDILTISFIKEGILQRTILLLLHSRKWDVKKGQKLKKIFDLQGRIFQTCMGERRLTSVTLFTPSTVIIIGKKKKGSVFHKGTPAAGRQTHFPIIFRYVFSCRNCFSIPSSVGVRSSTSNPLPRWSLLSTPSTSCTDILPLSCSQLLCPSSVNPCPQTPVKSPVSNLQPNLASLSIGDLHADVPKPLHAMLPKWAQHTPDPALGPFPLPKSEWPTRRVAVYNFSEPCYLEASVPYQITGPSTSTSHLKQQLEANTSALMAPLLSILPIQPFLAPGDLLSLSPASNITPQLFCSRLRAYLLLLSPTRKMVNWPSFSLVPGSLTPLLAFAAPQQGRAREL